MRDPTEATVGIATAAQIVAGETAAPEDATGVVIVVAVTEVMIERPLLEVMQVATRVGAEAGVVMMIADTHAVTEEVMGIITAAAVAAETARDLVRLAGTTVLEMTIATAMTAAIIVAETKTGTATGGHRNATPLPC